MRKVVVVAIREYNAAVRTKAFLLGLLMMPLLMGGSLIGQRLLQNYRDTSPRRFAVLDRTPGAVLLPELQKAIEQHNEQVRQAEAKNPQPPFEIEAAASEDDLDAQRQRLSDRARQGQLAGVLEIGPAAAELQPAADRAQAAIVYRASRVTEQEFPNLVRTVLPQAIQRLRCQAAKLPLDQVALVTRPVTVDSRGLLRKEKEGGRSESNQVAGVLAPALLMVLMFMLILMSATPLMQGVVEEKMQRIAEVLLASVTPFQLMLGKLLGMTGVSLTIAAVYLGGAYWAAQRYGMAEYVSLGLVLWFVLFQALAALMYGSLFIAVGAACTDMRETQNLLWPVMLLATMPMFVLANVLREPNSSVVTGLSFFPFATPTLMLARQSIPPGVPLWQPIVGAMGMLLTTLLCVWAAGRIFRVGILLMGKGASPIEMARWVWRG